MEHLEGQKAYEKLYLFSVTCFTHTHGKINPDPHWYPARQALKLHPIPADGAVGVEVEGHQAFWTCDTKPFILVLTTVPPHTDSLGVSTKTKAGLVTEDDPLPFCHSMTVWYDTTAVFGDGDVVLRTVVVTVCVHVVLRGAAVCQWCCTNRTTHGGHHCLLDVAVGSVRTPTGPPQSRWTVRDDSSSAAAQCSVGHPLVLHQWKQDAAPQDAAHKTLPTGHCPQDTAQRTLPKGRHSQDAGHTMLPHRTLPTGRCPQDTAHRTLPTGRCPTGRCLQDTAPQDAAHRTLPTGRCPQDTAQRTLPKGRHSQDAGHRMLPHRMLPTGCCPQDAAHRTLPTGHCPQDAAHRTLPTGHCPQDAAPQDTAPQDAAPQDAAYRTLPTGRCPQDAAHRMLPTGRCPQDAVGLNSFGWWTSLSPAVTLSTNNRCAWTGYGLDKQVSGCSHISVQALLPQGTEGGVLKDDDVLQNLPGGTTARLYFRDLGPQLGWTMVFMSEYVGPLLIYLLFYVRVPYIYTHEHTFTSSPHPVVSLACACHSFHYIKRLVETIFVHRFSHGTMPLRTMLRDPHRTTTEQV
ncbi:hypothetical protein NFI96_004098 [Prochilodus magdalenae]|nr:hypothetical protein NFI96_004098 [Prochilodus magdalenae]